VLAIGGPILRRARDFTADFTDGRCFAGCWNNLTFCLWGRGVELLIDSVTMAFTGQIKIYANLLCDVGVRYPGAFADGCGGHLPS
jgi:hypothetical protein